MVFFLEKQDFFPYSVADYLAFYAKDHDLGIWLEEPPNCIFEMLAFNFNDWAKILIVEGNM